MRGIALNAAALALTVCASSACSSDETGGSGGAATTASYADGSSSSSSATGPGGSGGSGGAATGGSGGSAGAGGGCQTCSELVINNAPPSDACPGTSAMLIGALVTCICQPTVCGGPMQGCYAACTMMATPDAACLACDQMAAQDACKDQTAACMADQ